MPIASHRRDRRLLVAVLLSILLASMSAPPVHAQAPASNPELTTRARNAVLMDAETGAVLFQYKADDLMSPASMSKLMTATMVFKAIKSGQLKPSDEFVMSVNAWRTGGAPSGTSAMLVPVNNRVRLDELLQGIIIQSGNDACIAVAEGIAGSESKFADLMTQEARRLGLKKSTFKNATGLFHPEHLMTVRELAQLARHIMKEYPDQFALFGQKEFLYRKHKFINRNPLLFASIGVDGMKTGYVKEAGYGMVATARQDQRRLIAVVGGLHTAEERKSEAQKLIEWGFKNLAEFKVFDAGEIVGQARVWGGNRMFVPLVGKSDIMIALPRFPANQRLKAEIIYQGPLKAPIQKGDVVAHLRVTSSSNAINEIPLMAAEEVRTSGTMRKGLDTLVHLALRLIPL